MGEAEAAYSSSTVDPWRRMLSAVGTVQYESYEVKGGQTLYTSSTPRNRQAETRSNPSLLVNARSMGSETDPGF